MDNYRKTIEAYDRIAPEYSRKHFTHFRIDEFAFYKETINGSAVIDLGCGAGRDAAVFIDNGFDYTGIDASKGMIEQARKRVPNGKFEQKDFADTGFADNTFDGFWAEASFLHVPKQHLPGVLQEARRITKEGGIGFISIKEKTDMDEGIVEEQKYGGISRYFAFYTQEEFKKLLEDSGFTIIKTVQRKKEDGSMWLCYFATSSNQRLSFENS